LCPANLFRLSQQPKAAIRDGGGGTAEAKSLPSQAAIRIDEL